MKIFAHALVQVSSLLDAILVAGVFALVWQPALAGPGPHLLLLLLLVPFWMVLFRFFGFYESHRMETMGSLARTLLSALVTGTIVIAPFLWLFGLPGRLSSLLWFSAICFAVLFAQKWLLYAFLHRIRRRGFDRHNVCVFGSWEDAEDIVRRLSKQTEWGLRVVCVGVGSPRERQLFAYPSRQPLHVSFEDVLRTQAVDELIIAVTPERLPSEKETFRLCEQYGLPGRVLLDTRETKIDGRNLERFIGDVSIAIGRIPCDGLALAMKRCMDFFLALALLLLLAPVMVIVALLVKLSSPGPVVFRQTRVGLRGQRFTMYKFRTMVDNAELLLPAIASKSITQGPIFKAREDWRTTRIGRVLRRFSLDELPQLIHVLKGDMSLVGPRPLPVHEAEAITGPYRRRFCMPPGITCLWQVNGRSEVGYDAWMNYDLEYVDRWSFSLDLKLLLWTIPAVLSGRGAY